MEMTKLAQYMRPKVKAVTTLLPGGMQLSCLTQIELRVKDLI